MYFTYVKVSNILIQISTIWI